MYAGFHVSFLSAVTYAKEQDTRLKYAKSKT